MNEINKEIEKLNLEHLYPRSYKLLLQYQSIIKPDDMYDVLTKWFYTFGISIIALTHHDYFLAAIKLQKLNYFSIEDKLITLSNECDSEPEISIIKAIELLFQKIEELLQKNEESVEIEEI
jgi:hypothetical protein